MFEALVWVAFFFDIVFVMMLYHLLIKHDNLSGADGKLAFYSIFVIPLVFWFIYIPSYIPNGEYTINTTVTTETGNEYDLDVDIYAVDETYAVNQINWPNGGFSYDTSETYVSAGKDVEILDQSDKTYYVHMKKPSLSSKERFAKLDIADKCVWFAAEILAVLCAVLDLIMGIRERKRDSKSQ